MTWFEIILLAGAAFCTSALTAVVGAGSGRQLLAGVDETHFQRAFRLMLIALALKLIVVDGLFAL